ncbi:MAG: LPS export ABC transporter periplasmic protein LptC [Gammaproteobacteria bacterium]|nr:LPS export ABC transporter periplasmic protein LptC [Gammaproteobacteria bacterium]MDH5628983.1 LPS export ABC transporter periplasmic protein LptC [Gammaproteobacteria bacterium]
MVTRRTKLLFISTLITLILGLSYWQGDSVVGSDTLLKPSQADYFFSQVTFKFFDESGQIVNQIKSEKIEHFKSGNYSDVVNPEIRIMDKEDSNWEITANSAQLDHDKENIKIFDGVVIQQNIISNNLPVVNSQISTQSLVFDMAANTAFSNVQVEIRSDKILTRADRLDIDFNQELLQLDGNVISQEQTNEQ